jgi:hypothetical protein
MVDEACVHWRVEVSDLITGETSLYGRFHDKDAAERWIERNVPIPARHAYRAVGIRGTRVTDRSM